MATTAAAIKEPGRTYRMVIGIIGLYAIATVAALPFAGRLGPTIPAITPAFVGVVMAVDLSTSFLLMVRFRAARSWSLLLLACAYLFGGLLTILHLLTFPDVIVPNGVVFGSAASAAWLFLCWMGGYAALTMAAVLCETFLPDRRIERRHLGRAIRIGIGTVLAAVFGCLLAVTAFVDELPPLMQGSSWTVLNRTCAAASVMALAVTLVLLAVRGRDVLFVWLGLAITAMLSANVLSLAGGGRYTLGWTVGRLSWIASACVLFLFFMGQFAAQQRALARARDTLERRVVARTADLTRTVTQRDRLVQEVYHRVANNLQVVDSLLAMEHRGLGDLAGRQALARLRHRVFVLGLVHQQLMASDDLERFSIAPFLRELTSALVRAMTPDAGRIGVTVEAEAVPVTLDFAVPTGLLVTELVSIALRNGLVGKVTVGFRREEGGYGVLTVSADGQDPANAEATTLASVLVEDRLIQGLARQLGGSLRVVEQGGTQVELRMPLPEPT